MKAFIKKNIVNFICAGLILTVCLWNLRDYDYIRSVDEFGYFGVAASFAGWDWGDVLATSDYYSFGYSFLLVPFMLLARLGIPMALIYKAVILLNGCFLVGVFALVMHVQREIFPGFPDQLQSAAALIMALYIANAVQSNTAGVEMCLRFLFWAILSTLISFVKKPGIGNSTLLIGLSIYIFTVHMRAIGVSIAVAGALALYVISHIKAINKKLLIYMIGLIVVGILAFGGMKRYITSEVYVNKYEKSKQEITDESVELGAQVEKISSSNVNDLQANIGGAAELLTRNGIKDLILSFCGKLFYAFSATILLGAVGFMVAIRKIWEVIINKVKRRNETPWGTLQWYIFFSLFALCNSLGVSAIFKCMPFYREGALYLCQVETIVFGRYADFALGGVMVLGIYGLYHCKEYFFQIIISIMCFLGLSWIVQYQFDAMIVNLANDKIADFRINQTPWCYILSNGDINYFAYYVAVVSLSIFTMLLFLSFYSKRKFNLFAVGMLAVCIMWGAMEVKYSDEYNQSKSYRDEQIKTVWNWIEMTDSNTDIYYIANNYGDGGSDVKILQWMLGERSIHVRTLEDTDKIDDTNVIVLCGSNSKKISEYLDAQRMLIFDSEAMRVYTTYLR